MHDKLCQVLSLQILDPHSIIDWCRSNVTTLFDFFDSPRMGAEKGVLVIPPFDRGRYVQNHSIGGLRRAKVTLLHDFFRFQKIAADVCVGLQDPHDEWFSSRISRQMIKVKRPSIPSRLKKEHHVTVMSADM